MLQRLIFRLPCQSGPLAGLQQRHQPGTQRHRHLPRLWYEFRV